MSVWKSKRNGLGTVMPSVLQAFLLLIVGLTSLCFATEYLCVHVYHLGFPYNWPLLPYFPTHFGDYSIFRTRFAFFHSSRFFTFSAAPPFTYPAPVAVFYRIFYTVPKTVPFALFILVVGLLSCFLFARTLMREGLTRLKASLFVALIFCCSYPFFFEFEQANLEIVIWILLACGTVCFLRRHAYWAAVLFGIAAAAKLFPFVFLGLFLSRRQYRATAVFVVTALVTTAACLWLVCPDLAVSWHGVEAGLVFFRTEFVLQVRPILVGVNHSLFSLVQFAVVSRHASGHAYAYGNPATLSRISSLYLATVAVSGIALYFLRIRKLPVANQVLSLVIASILLPPISFDYTLTHLYIPWAILVLLAFRSSARAVPGLLGAMLCFAILFAPETEFISFEHTLGGQIKCLTLLALFVISLRYPFSSVYDNQQPVRISVNKGMNV